MAFTTSYIGLWAFTLFLTLVAIGLLREVTDLRHSIITTGLNRTTPLVIGSRAPRFSALNAHSKETVTSDVLNGKATLLLFLSPHCSICHALVRNLKAF